MKKILSILSTIFLFTIISNNITACNTPNTNTKTNQIIEPKLTPQQPPKNSNWKLIDRTTAIKEQNSGKVYIGIFGVDSKFNIINWKAIKGYSVSLYRYKAIYRWNGVGEPIIPTIDTATGEITNWNEKNNLLKLFFLKHSCQFHKHN